MMTITTNTIIALVSIATLLRIALSAPAAEWFPSILSAAPSLADCFTSLIKHRGTSSISFSASANISWLSLKANNNNNPSSSSSSLVVAGAHPSNALIGHRLCNSSNNSNNSPQQQGLIITAPEQCLPHPARCECTCQTIAASTTSFGFHYTTMVTHTGPTHQQDT